ncbi:hypothetical protein CAMGR0001_2295 [Campylobacter gracilis RM3268]|uniref:Uncharacterized protein n=1 Tax=Campylobacter gracilis RM3268 TaxID=553220 RepID=C8PHA1_9BACT|nr:hypothetical protein CAMGR0001_2295 [Campylobacter gracilis RM3268]
MRCRRCFSSGKFWAKFKCRADKIYVGTAAKSSHAKALCASSPNLAINLLVAQQSVCGKLAQ